VSWARNDALEESMMDDSKSTKSADQNGGNPEEEKEITQGKTPRPFDPNKIRIKKIELAISNAMQMLEAGELDVAPDFQRNDVWDDVRKSKLVESLLVRIPLPVFYFDELSPKKGFDIQYAVIDGVQRLTTLEQFINDKSETRLRLQGMELLTDLEGEDFDHLDSALKRRIMSAQIVVYVIEPGTPETAKLNIFKRINTGGMPLTAQEIRHAMNPGPVRKFLKDLASVPEFVKAVRPPVAKSMSTRMTDRECVIRFIAFLEGGVQEYTSAKMDLDGFLNEAMGRVNNLDDGGREVLARRFRRAVHHAHACFGVNAFRKPEAGGPLNKSLFEATLVALDARSDQELELLATRQERLLEAYVKALADPEIFASVTASTGDPKRVARRFAALSKVLDEALA
jgi:hypothetical protein